MLLTVCRLVLMRLKSCRLHLLNVFISGCEMPHLSCGGRRTTFGSQFSPAVGFSILRDETQAIGLGFHPWLLMKSPASQVAFVLCLMSLFLSQDPIHVHICLVAYFLRLPLAVTLSQTLVDSSRSVVVLGALCWSLCITPESSL